MNIKHLISMLGILFLLIALSCEKPETEIAPKEELSVLSFSQSFLCQPIELNHQMIALTEINDSAYLAGFDSIGNILWQKPAEKYSIPGLPVNLTGRLSIDKSLSDELILKMFFSVQEQNTNRVIQVIKAVGFDLSGDYKWEMIDTIHQPRDFINDPTGTPIKTAFKYIDMVNFSDGSHSVVSSQNFDLEQVTYVQLTNYSNTGKFLKNSYIKLPGSRIIEKAFLTSDNRFLFFDRTDNTKQFYLMTDTASNIFFETVIPQNIWEHYFIYENKEGNFLISAAILGNLGNYIGIVLKMDREGNITGFLNPKNGPTWLMTSVQEKPDGYIFTGFTAGSTLLLFFDWRFTFQQNEYHALVQKTDPSGTEMWNNLVPGIYNTAGAVTTGQSNTCLFLGKYDNTVKSVYLMKLDAHGKIIN